jgi:hypothetical protein
MRRGAAGQVGHRFRAEVERGRHLTREPEPEVNLADLAHLPDLASAGVIPPVSVAAGVSTIDF